jgi:WD40 repeat protein
MKAKMLRPLQTILTIVLASGASYLQASNWRVGDVFVGTGNGQHRVYDKAGNFKETISDGLGGSTGGCGCDATGHLWTTNSSSAKVLRYKIDHPHGILQTISVTGAGAGAGSIVFARNGDFYVGNPDGDGSIRKYKLNKETEPPSYVLDRTYVVELENSGSDWIDITADEKILYTSEGRLIKQLDPSNNALAEFANLGSAGGSNVGLFALRVLPDGGVAAADRRNIKRLNSNGVVVQTYDVAGEDEWKFLTLDPTKTSLWAGDATTGNFYKLNLASGAIEVGPVKVPSGNLSGLCVHGDSSAAQAVPYLFTTSANPSATFDPLGDGSNKLTVTLNGASGSLTFRASFIDQNAGFSDSGMPCTISRTVDGVNQCVVWNIEAAPGLAFLTADLQIFQPNTDEHTKLLKNEATDVTTFFTNIDPGGTVDDFSVFSLNQAAVTGSAVSCGYQSPIEGSVYNLGSNLSFRFQAAINCKKGPFENDLEARLSLVRLVEDGAPHPVEVKVVGISDAPPIYRLQADGTYHLNVKTTNLLAGDYLATTFDDSGQIPAFEVQFTLR